MPFQGAGDSGDGHGWTSRTTHFTDYLIHIAEQWNQ